MFYHLSYFEVIYLDRYFKMMKVEVISNTKSLSFSGVFLLKRGWFFVMSGVAAFGAYPSTFQLSGTWFSSPLQRKSSERMQWYLIGISRYFWGMCICTVLKDCGLRRRNRISNEGGARRPALTLPQKGANAKSTLRKYFSRSSTWIHKQASMSHRPSPSSKFPMGWLRISPCLPSHGCFFAPWLICSPSADLYPLLELCAHLPAKVLPPSQRALQSCGRVDTSASIAVAPAESGRGLSCCSRNPKMMG